MHTLRKLSTSELKKQLNRYISDSPDKSEKAEELTELRVYQIELEIQNRELREAQQRLELSRNRYAELYDFAPIGYMSLTPTGVIHEVT